MELHTALNAFVLFSTVLSCWLFSIWNRESWGNATLKFIFLSQTICGILLLLWHNGLLIKGVNA